ncbi:MAG: redoxin domain-containing protein [Opitutales bacterium]|nr:redoxin domain-containing protein [Opitutales bacterium]
MKTIGDSLDLNLSLTAVRSGEASTVKLGDLLTRPTVFSIYMRNNTGSCDKQNTSLVAHAAELDAAGVNLVAISRDKPPAHAKYAAKLGIPYTLISDPDDTFAKEADAIVEKSMYGKKYLGPARAAFLVDTDGRITGVIEKVDSKNHGEELLALIQG